MKFSAVLEKLPVTWKWGELGFSLKCVCGNWKIGIKIITRILNSWSNGCSDLFSVQCSYQETTEIGNTGPWLVDNQSRDLINEFWLFGCWFLPGNSERMHPQRFPFQGLSTLDCCQPGKRLNITKFGNFPKNTIYGHVTWHLLYLITSLHSKTLTNSDVF